MRDFIQITKDDVLPRLMNGEEVYAFSIKVAKNGNVCLDSRKLRNEKLEIIANIVNDPNSVLFVKKEVRND